MSIRDLYLAEDALGLAEAVRRGDASPAELLEVALELAAETNPTINAIVVPAYDQARRWAAAGPPRGPFTGVPYLLKDLSAKHKGLRMTNGSRLFRDYVPDFDSDLTTRLVQAGLVIFGRSASPELGLTTSTESALFGLTRNPWQLDHAAGGSSGGAAAAVAAGIVPAAHATDGGGAIRIPASGCGVFGLKPTRARVPAGPDVGEGWNGLSAQHAVTRTVRDSAALLDASCGAASGDPYHAPPRERPYLDEVGTRPARLRIAWTTTGWNSADTHPDCIAATLAAVQLCRDLGHQLVEARPEIDTEALGGATRLVDGANVLAALEARAAELGRPIDPERDVEPITWATAQGGSERKPADYVRAVRVIHATGRVVASFFERYDLLLTPTMAAPPQPLGALSLSHPDPARYVANLLKTIAFTQLMNVAGNPAMSVPLHWNSDGLPIGLQFAARFGDEATLFRLAGQLEEARPWRQRRPPLR